MKVRSTLKRIRMTMRGWRFGHRVSTGIGNNSNASHWQHKMEHLHAAKETPHLSRPLAANATTQSRCPLNTKASPST